MKTAKESGQNSLDYNPAESLVRKSSGRLCVVILEDRGELVYYFYGADVKISCIASELRDKIATEIGLVLPGSADDVGKRYGLVVPETWTPGALSSMVGEIQATRMGKVQMVGTKQLQIPVGKVESIRFMQKPVADALVQYLSEYPMELQTLDEVHALIEGLSKDGVT